MLLQMIQGSAGIAVDSAAQKLGCTVRTIWRDLRVLEQAGFPLYDDKGSDGRRSVWKLEEKFTLGLPVKLTLAETAALLMSRDLLRPLGTHSVAAAIDMAFDKLGRAPSPDALHVLAQMRARSRVRAVSATLQLPAAEHVALSHREPGGRSGHAMTRYPMNRDEENRARVDP